jgi:hypothetical protein
LHIAAFIFATFFASMARACCLLILQRELTAFTAAVIRTAAFIASRREFITSLALTAELLYCCNLLLQLELAALWLNSNGLLNFLLQR